MINFHRIVGFEWDVGNAYKSQDKHGISQVQASIQGDAVRVTGAKRDDLQETMALLKKEVTEAPLGFNNFRD